MLIAREGAQIVRLNQHQPGGPRSPDYPVIKDFSKEVWEDSDDVKTNQLIH
jgi:hypothetical protein